MLFTVNLIYDAKIKGAPSETQRKISKPRIKRTRDVERGTERFLRSGQLG